MFGFHQSDTVSPISVQGRMYSIILLDIIFNDLQIGYEYTYIVTEYFT